MNSFGGTPQLQPPLPGNRENKCRETFKARLPFQNHSIFLRHSARWIIFGMNQGDDVLEFQIAKPVIANCARRFGGESAVPEIALQPVADLNFHFAVYFVVKKTAVASESTARSYNHGELRWQTVSVPADHFIKETLRLFTRHRAHRETHEIFVRHQFHHAIEIIGGEWTQN